MANDKTPVNCTNVVVVADDVDGVADIVDAVAGDAADVDIQHLLDGSFVGVTRETYCSMDDSCRLPKPPRPRATASPEMLDVDANELCRWKSVS